MKLYFVRHGRTIWNLEGRFQGAGGDSPLLPESIDTLKALGQYLSNIPFDATTKSYVRDYSADGLTVHFVCVSEGKTTMDSDYAFKKGNVTVTQGENSKLTIVNTYTIGNMPFPITATFNGVKSE